MKKNTPIDVWKHINMHGGDRSVCWEWGQVPGGAKGRSKQRAYFSIAGKKMMVTHIIWQLTRGEQVPAGQMVRHKCDNSICCNPEHLELGSHADNTDDMVSRDRHGLPSHVVRRIRVLLSRKRTHAEIAELYGIDRTVVTKIAGDKAHTHDNDYPTQEDFDAVDD